MESGIFGFLMKNWIDSAKKIRASPKFAFRGQMNRCEGGCVTSGEFDMDRESKMKVNRGKSIWGGKSKLKGKVKE